MLENYNSQCLLGKLLALLVLILINYNTNITMCYSTGATTISLMTLIKETLSIECHCNKYFFTFDLSHCHYSKCRLGECRGTTNTLSSSNYCQNY
jgi:hypothetical protein